MRNALFLPSRRSQLLNVLFDALNRKNRDPILAPRVLKDLFCPLQR